MRTTSTRETGCEIFAALMKGDRTREQIEQVTGLCRPAIHGWLKTLQNSGIVYRKKCRTASSRQQILYCLQPKPFEKEDWS